MSNVDELVKDVQDAVHRESKAQIPYINLTKQEAKAAIRTVVEFLRDDDDLMGFNEILKQLED